MSELFEFLSDTIDFFVDFWWLILAVIIIATILVLNSPEEKEKRAQRRELKAKERDRKERLREKYRRVFCDYPWVHMGGLPLPQMTECEAWACENCLLFYCAQPFVLEYSSLISIEFMTRTQVTKHYMDDVTGAVAGAAAFGAIGALVCGGTKTVTETANSYFVAVTYKSDGQVKYILFDVTKSGGAAKQFVKRVEGKANGAVGEVRVL